MIPGLTRNRDCLVQEPDQNPTSTIASRGVEQWNPPRVPCRLRRLIERELVRTSRIALVAGVATSLIMGMGAAAHAETTTPAAQVTASQCLAAKNVWVVVERADGAQEGGCATQFGTGMEALASAGFTSTGGAFVQTINGYPNPAPEGHYWSYWQGGAAADGSVSWTFSNVGASSSSPQPGTVEGWHYVSWQTPGATTPPNWNVPQDPIQPPRVETKVTGVKGDHTGDGIADVFAVDRAGRLQFHAGSRDGKLTYLGQVGTGWDGMDYITQVSDVDGDGRSDLLARRSSDDSLWLFRATGNGYLSSWKKMGQNWGSMDMIVPVGSLAGGSTQYVVARRATDGALFRYVMTKDGLSQIAHIGQNWQGMEQLLSVGDFTGDGRSDLLAIRGDGTLWMYAGTASAGISAGKQVGQGWQGFVLAFSAGDLSGDGRGDLLGQRSDGSVFAYTNLVGRWGTAREVYTGAQDYLLMA